MRLDVIDSTRIERPRPFDPRSAYAERFWLPVIGPTSLWLARRVVDDGGVNVPAQELARSLGVNERVLVASAARLATFGVGMWYPDYDTGGVLRQWPWLSIRSVRKLPPPLQQAHQQMRRSVMVA